MKFKWNEITVDSSFDSIISFSKSSIFCFVVRKSIPEKILVFDAVNE
jgi:hypothetical protein